MIPLAIINLDLNSILSTPDSRSQWLRGLFGQRPWPQLDLFSFSPHASSTPIYHGTQARADTALSRPPKTQASNSPMTRFLAATLHLCLHTRRKTSTSHLDLPLQHSTAAATQTLEVPISSLRNPSSGGFSGPTTGQNIPSLSLYAPLSRRRTVRSSAGKAP